MDYTRNLKLDVNPDSVPQVVRVKQGDGSARFIAVSLTKDNAAYTPESGVSYYFRCEKPDGTAVITDSVMTDQRFGRKLIVVSNGVITIELIDQVDAVAGRCRCDLCLMKDNRILSTIPFFIEVVRAPDVGRQIVSTDDFLVLMNAISSAASAVSAANAAVSNAETAIANANTARTNANNAATAANNAATAATTAKNNAVTATTNATNAATAANNAATAATTAKNNADAATTNANTAANDLKNMTVSAMQLSATASPTATVTGGSGTPFNISFGMPKANGVKTTTTTYGTSMSESTLPSSWVSSMTALIVPDGSFVWTRTVLTYDNNTTATFYSKAAQGYPGPPGVAVQDDEPVTDVLLWVDPDDGENIIIPEIDDTAASSVSTYSSEKIEERFVANDDPANIVASGYLNAASGFTVTSSNFATYGKIGMLYLIAECTVAQTSGTDGIAVATMTSGYRPVFSASAYSNDAGSYAAIGQNGNVTVFKDFAVGDRIIIRSTYIIA